MHIFSVQEKGNIDVAIRYYLVAIEVCDILVILVLINDQLLK